MKSVRQCSLLAILILLAPLAASAQEKPFRPPAVPLVTSDPYLSIWSPADHLTDRATRHWTRRPHSLESMIRIDGKTYRLMGDGSEDPAFPQKSVQVLPTRSIYEFDDGHIHVTMTFMSPFLPDDLDALSLPLSYITWEVRSVDGASHTISIYDSVSSQLVVHASSQKVDWAREPAGDMLALKVGTAEQPILQRMGDDTRIDWGYAYLSAPQAQVKAGIGAHDALVTAFSSNGALPAQDDTRMPRAVNDEQPVLAIVFDIGNVAAAPVSRHAIVAYDEIYSIKYFGQKLRPYWRRNGATAAQMLQKAEQEYPQLVKRCTAFDDELMADLTKAGGARYAQIAALSYRQCICACGLAADSKGQPLLFTKENTSNGDIATVDVIYPMDPIFIFLSPTLAKASLVSVLDYAASDHWKFPNAPHDLGTYPNVFGRDDGGEGMPVEESGNMLLLCDAIAHAEGNAKFVDKWWPQLTQWAKYLEQYGLDPENQLCTDDFMGHLAHNANLSVKAILGLAAYGDLCRMRGDEATAKRYFDLAKTDAQHWMKVAAEGDHYRLAFDKPNTWSQKYNLVWDKLLGLNIFPDEVARKELAFYKTVMQKYGLPLDSRTKLTKTDWTIWTATMAENQADFEAFISPIWDYLDQTTTRDPLSDSYITDNLKSGGMHARPVMGGAFIKMLAYPDIWKKWASRDKTQAGPWAELPQPPVIKEVVPTARIAKSTWQYTLTKPAANWATPEFDAGAWKQGPGGFGTEGTPGAVIGTTWRTNDIWIRREITLPEQLPGDLRLLVHHDEDVEVYINGVLAANATDFLTSYEPMDIRKPAQALLKPGAKVVIAAHCHQTRGGQYVDVGLAEVIEKQP